MKISFIRHLPTTNNINSIFLGRLDLDCNSEYINEHLQQINATFEKMSFNIVFCSPLKRARQSAEIYFPGTHYFVDRRLIERELGEWKNKPKRNVKENFPQAYYPNGNLDFNYTPPNGESFVSVLRRVSSFILDLQDNYEKSDSIAVITHNGIITAVQCLLNSDYSTKNIKPFPFAKEFIVETTPQFLNHIETVFLDTNRYTE